MKNKIFMPLILLSNCLIMFGQSNCIPSFSGSNIFIDNFAFHTLVNTYSGVDSDKYVFYPNTLFTTTVTIGKTYPITIAQNYSSGIYGKFAVWIDYNNDKLFDNSELVLYDSISHYTTSGFVNIPNNNNYVGQRRLRVIYAWYPLTVTPCGKFSDGECEDYIINIVSNQPDSQTYCIPFNPPGVDNFIMALLHESPCIRKKESNGVVLR